MDAMMDRQDEIDRRERQDFMVCGPLLAGTIPTPTMAASLFSDTPYDLYEFAVPVSELKCPHCGEPSQTHPTYRQLRSNFGNREKLSLAYNRDGAP